MLSQSVSCKQTERAIDLSSALCHLHLLPKPCCVLFFKMLSAAIEVSEEESDDEGARRGEEDENEGAARRREEDEDEGAARRREEDEDESL